MAYESTKNWIEDGIWNPTWGELPGTTWMHEDLLEELQPNAVSNDEQTPRLPSPRFNSEPTPDVYNDEDQRQLNARTKNATLQLPSTGALSDTGQRRLTVEDQLPAATKVPGEVSG
ncbi:hypothetical protein BU26DRAFT_561215 [Trematosphaeria pertusa]|uniref:Uncharacterized protein n=1 Tax=Trematosphaeria pertusa TaxID=390896 RepID=A0A6A6IXP1_9PLEO|nr:uncharacterized protein BU26DRAFT_561215 [Trematosphaeria pertusa]KAF2253953.1 hypothetical protein BU26DRAFT_561215 [Trematosphaeria pertusa]